MRLLVTVPALQALRQATAWLIMTLGRKNTNKPMESHIRFNPWRGRYYNTPRSIFSRPTFILGGSTYGDGAETTTDEDAERTSELLDYYFDGSGGRWKATYTRFINAVYGAETDRSEREAYFDSILFNNYLQEYAGACPTDAPNFNYKGERHRLAFYETLHIHAPEVVISWGNLVWEGLPNDWGYGPARFEAPISVLGIPFHGCMTYPFAGREILLVGVNHPSTAFSRDFHHELFSLLGLLRADLVEKKGA